MDQLIEIMSRIRPDIDFMTATTLIDDDLLDSFDIIAIVGEVNHEFDVEINVNDLLPENFNSASALYELIKKLQEED
ncbi:MAG: acyl carrier protein [Erysipelotrichaceae bacterium]|nr:acyl carrier protein [Erysipelotrichaceae bacterium]